MRVLTPDEISLFPRAFTETLDMARLRLINRTHNPFASGKILVRGYDIYWKDYPENFIDKPICEQAVLAHELCHVWQYTTGRLSAWRYITQPENWVYGYDFDPSKTFDDYATEKQADLFQDWYSLNNGHPANRHRADSLAPNLVQINAVVPFDWKAATDEVIEDSGALMV